MVVKAIVLDGKDNVATCTSNVSSGDVIECIGSSTATLESVEAIPIWHKAALRAIGADESVIKYGELIGRTLVDIPKGGWVSHENIYSVPRDYRDEYINAGK